MFLGGGGIKTAIFCRRTLRMGYYSSAIKIPHQQLFKDDRRTSGGNAGIVRCGCERADGGRS